MNKKREESVTYKKKNKKNTSHKMRLQKEKRNKKNEKGNIRSQVSQSFINEH